MTDARRQRFHELHRHGFFLIPNPWDVGSAKLLASAGFPALATTSSGFAASLGRADGSVSLAELVDHVGALAAAVDVPVNVDAEHCYDDPVATVAALAGAGAAGVSIEDYDRAGPGIDPLAIAVERVGRAAEEAHRHDVLLTARAENHLHGIDDLDDTVARLTAYRDAGADVLYAPGLRSLDDIARVVAVGLPVNVLAMAGGPTMPELAAVGVRRVSTGGAFARVAYGALLRAADELRDRGTTGYAGDAIPMADLQRALGH